jgi:hypothetical protein
MHQNHSQNSEIADQASGKPDPNPYILSFFRVLVERKGETHEPEALEKLLNDMYCLFETMLGQNMVDSLPDDMRHRYLSLAEDPANLAYEKIGAVFDGNIPDCRQVIKDTMKQFAEIFLKNREFTPTVIKIDAPYQIG